MRLLVLTELFLPTKGGTAVWFAEVYRRISGNEIHIVTADVPGAEEIDAGHPNTVHRLNLQRIAWLKPESLLMYWRFFTCSLGLAMHHRFQAVHAGRVLPEGLIAWLVARLIGVPVVIYAHGEEITTWRHPVKFRVMGFVYRHANKVVANSEFTREELLKLGVKLERILIINPGVDTERFRPGLPCDDLKASIGLRPGQKLILSVGRLSRRKGFDMVIRSLAELVNKGEDVHYVLIGIGDDREYLIDLAEKYFVSGRVHLLGHVAADDLPRWYNACDVFAMPNREINGDTEGFGMVFVEAGACGKPVVAGKAGGTGAAVVDGQSGYRIDSSQEEEVTNALFTLLREESRAKEMGEYALLQIQARFAWERVAEKTIAMMNTVRDD